MLIGDHEDCLECSGINIAVLWLELLILVRNPVGLQIVSTRSRWLSTVYFHPLYRGTWFPTPSYVRIDEQSKSVVSIRYIAVLGFQQRSPRFMMMGRSSFHPLYRGTWFPTGEK